MTTHTETLECADCSEPITDGVGIETPYDGIICDDCKADNYVVCADCTDVIRDCDSSTTADGDGICETCRDSGDWWNCHHCHQLVSESTSVYGEREVCGDCLDERYTYCDYCEEYVLQGDDDHYHNEDDGCQCEAAFQQFQIRNDGHGMLDNDARAIVSLPSGIVSDVGIKAIAELLYPPAGQDGDYWGLRYYVLNGGMDARWQTREGNFTKRLSRYAYQNHKIKLSPEIVSAIGNTARAHSNGQDYAIEYTRQLNLSASDFVHSESCWWQSYSESRCALKANGGMGLRSFNDYGPVGRAWVMPLALAGDGSLMATNNTETPDAFMVFNGYGELSGYAPARIVAHMAGMTYRKVTFYGSPMYINGSVGYLVAPEDIARTFTDGTVSLSLSGC